MLDEPTVRAAVPGSASAFHGGDLGAADKLFGRPTEGWLDLSTGINPVPFPLPEIAPESWTRLPDAAAIAALTTAAASYFGVDDPDRVIAEDLSHSQEEQRYFCIGRDKSGEGILTVRFTFRKNRVRIFGAGYWRKGKKVYEQANSIH